MAKASKPYSEQRAWNYVLWLLGRKAYTKAELMQRLRKKEVSQEAITRIMAKLEDYRYVDDELFSRSYIRSRQQKKGVLALKQELYAKGVSEAIVEDVLASIEEDKQIVAARTLVEKQSWRWKGKAHERRAKAYAYLARRGFPSDVVRAALETFVAEDDAEIA